MINESYSYGKCNKFTIVIMNINGFINVSKLCNDIGKRYSNWTRNSTVIELIDALAESLNITADELMVSAKNEKNNLRGTYVHPQLMIHVAYWCSPIFAVKVGQRIDEWKKYSPENEHKFYKALSNIEPCKNASKEKEVQKKLHAKYGGEIEAKTPAGRIDLLTDDYLIEIKKYDDWKCALGQLLSYSYDHNDKKLIMYLFDVPINNKIGMIKERCKKYNVYVRIYDKVTD
uniref:KilA-N domain-containing protein n=1 Tax=viral metagenome TaxID=1070528 RepID=A0A6C0CBN0_9ZZZZ